jgi:predicted kinase
VSTAKRPTLILVSGEPGSGKTTLSLAISDALGLYRASKAEIARALDVTDSANTGNHDRAWQTYWTMLETLLDAGASIIADQTTWRGQCDAVIGQRLLSRASVRIVHCVTPQAQQRCVQRLVHTLGWSDEQVTALRARMDPRRERFVRPLSLDRPVLEVDTTDGYTPGLDRILDFVVAPDG